MILVVCAVGAELGGFERAGVEVVAVGVGPVDAALGTSRALAARRYALVVNAGIGGGFAGRAAVGESLAVTADRYVDLGREDRTPLSLPGGIRLAEVAAGDPALLRDLPARSGGTPLHRGPAVTSATITSTDARAADLAARYAPFGESMEGFAVFRAAELAGVRAAQVRGISNVVGDRERSGWDFRAGAAAAVAALHALLDVVKPPV